MPQITFEQIEEQLSQFWFGATVGAVDDRDPSAYPADMFDRLRLGTTPDPWLLNGVSRRSDHVLIGPVGVTLEAFSKADYSRIDNRPWWERHVRFTDSAGQLFLFEGPRHWEAS